MDNLQSFYYYRAYIKDQESLNSRPKAFLTIRKATIREDLLTKANSSFTVLDLPENINNGDILCVYDNEGSVIYQGIITKYGNNNFEKSDEVIESFIDTSQMQSFYKGEWIENIIYGFNPGTIDSSWTLYRYNIDNLVYPRLSDLDELEELSTTEIADSSTSTAMTTLGSNYYGKATTNLYFSSDTTTNVTFSTVGNGRVYLNGVLLDKIANGSSKIISCSFLAGWNKIDICFSRRSGNAGWSANPRLSTVASRMASSDETYTTDNKWIFTKYDPFGAEVYPYLSEFDSIEPSVTTTYADSSISTSLNIASYYSAKAVIYGYSSSAQVRAIKFTTNGNGTVYINGVLIGKTPEGVETSLRCQFNKGWNKIEVCYIEKTGNDGWNTSPKLGNIFLQLCSSADGVLEETAARTIENFAYGYQKNAAYRDTYMYQEKAPIKIVSRTSTSGLIPAFGDNDTSDMEEFIYSLYLNYGIVLKFRIPYDEWEIGSDSGGLCEIIKPDYTPIKVGDNSAYILNMSPTLETEEINKLIVFSSDNVYRTTFIATSTGTITEEPSSTAGRFGIVNTKVVWSDDDLDTIKSANLPNTMYNHKVTFDLLLSSKVYNYKDFILGMPLEIWNGSDYYDSVLTGYEFTINENETPSSIRLICGKVRTALTKKLNMR